MIPRHAVKRISGPCLLGLFFKAVNCALTDACMVKRNSRRTIRQRRNQKGTHIPISYPSKVYKYCMLDLSQSHQKPLQPACIGKGVYTGGGGGGGGGL